jgi:hypothetical protein
VKGQYECRCNPGYKGALCDAAPACPDCAARNRDDCTADDVCGLCLAGWGHNGPQATANAACTMRPVIDRASVHVMNPAHAIKGLRARRRRLQAVTGSKDPSLATDGDIYTHWIVPFDAAAARTDKPTLNLMFDTPVQATHYTIVAGNSHPQQDPTSWVVYCRRHDDPDGDWQLVDTETDESFDERHSTRTFAMTPTGNIHPLCDEISWVFTGIRDAQYQGGAGVDIFGVVTTDDERATFVPSLQLAEVQLFTPSCHNSLSSLCRAVITTVFAMLSCHDVASGAALQGAVRAQPRVLLHGHPGGGGGVGGGGGRPGRRRRAALLLRGGRGPGVLRPAARQDEARGDAEREDHRPRVQPRQPPEPGGCRAAAGARHYHSAILYGESL